MSLLDYENEDIEALVKQLVNDLKSPNTQIRQNAALKFSDESKASGFDMGGKPLYQDRIDKFNELTRKIAMDPIIRGLNDEERLVRIPLMWCLGHLNDARGVEPLIDALDDKDSGARGASAYNLVYLKNHSFLPLINVLNSKNKNIRRGAVFALGDMGKQEALDPLINALKDLDWNVRFKAIEGLGKIGNEEALEPISECLEDKSANVRRKAIEVIGLLGAGEKLPTREEMSKLAENQRLEIRINMNG
ncbi:HEAT repeat domain-containing protein [Methanobacterium sp.]|uniref:HEAT repeat domain-containing protein n=1 Tax=Methanobacterium sp. TaxID=2164 RepID=UPI003158B951